MEVDEAIRKLTAELQTKLEHRDISSFFDTSVIEEYIQMAYCVGFDEGSKSRSNRISVCQISKHGKLIKEFPSAAQASRSTKTEEILGRMN